jgi:hypothetical protein
MEEWISGDGGPTIVIQSSVVKKWRGAEDFENSLMNGGNIETDYDVICQCEEGINLIHRYGRDMLVFSDCEWVTSFYRVSPGVVAIVQVFGSDETLEELVLSCCKSSPYLSLSFAMQDKSLRLLVGADSGNGQMYGFSDIRFKPGIKQCDIYFTDEAQMAILKDI